MLVFLLLMNASGFAIMLLDKNLARRHRRLHMTGNRFLFTLDNRLLQLRQRRVDGRR